MREYIKNRGENTFDNKVFKFIKGEYTQFANLMNVKNVSSLEWVLSGGRPSIYHLEIILPPPHTKKLFLDEWRMFSLLQKRF